MTEEKTYPLFLYGTLRPGNPLWHRIKDSVRGEAYMVWARGYRLALSEAGNYPVMVPCGAGFGPQNKLVRGTLVQVAKTKAFDDIWQMEVGAGYEADLIEIEAGPTPDAMNWKGEAFAFIWNLSRFRDYGKILTPTFLADRATAVYDWNNTANRPWDFHNHSDIPGVEEVQSIPSQKPLDSDT